MKFIQLRILSAARKQCGSQKRGGQEACLSCFYHHYRTFPVMFLFNLPYSEPEIKGMIKAEKVSYCSLSTVHLLHST